MTDNQQVAVSFVPPEYQGPGLGHYGDYIFGHAQLSRNEHATLAALVDLQGTVTVVDEAHAPGADVIEALYQWLHQLGQTALPTLRRLWEDAAQHGSAEGLVRAQVNVSLDILLEEVQTWREHPDVRGQIWEAAFSGRDVQDALWDVPDMPLWGRALVLRLSLNTVDAARSGRFSKEALLGLPAQLVAQSGRTDIFDGLSVAARETAAGLLDQMDGTAGDVIAAAAALED